MTTEFLEKLGIRVHSETDSEIRCFCPFHEDDNPSSSFSKSKGVFNCFVCGGETLDSLIEKLGEDGLEYSYGVDDLQRKLKEKLSDNPPPNKRTKDIKNEISKLEKKLKEDDDLTIIY